MAIPRQRSWFRRLAGRTPVYDAALALFVAFTGWSQAYRWYFEEWIRLSIFIAILTAAAVVVSIAKAVVQWRSARKEESVHELEGCLETLHSILTAAGTESAGLRITVHVPVDDEQSLEQVLDYVGDARGGATASRRFRPQSGAAGEALRTRRHFVVGSRENDDYESYIQELIEQWHYTEVDARKLNPATMSCLAVPLKHEGTQEIEGILYLDSTDRGFFDDVRIGLTLMACVGIAKFVARRYAMIER